jgi:hypothetical protein
MATFWRVLYGKTFCVKPHLSLLEENVSLNSKTEKMGFCGRFLHAAVGSNPTPPVPEMSILGLSSIVKIE